MKSSLLTRSRFALTTLAALLSVVLCDCGGGGGGGGGSAQPTPVSFTGTTAVGAALAGATVTYTCRTGGGTTTSDSNGSYTLSANAQTPCLATASAGGVTLHSLAVSAGVNNVTPLTDLLVSYIAGQLGTSVSSLYSGFTGNASAISLISNASQVNADQTAVVTLLNTSYGTSLSSASFLTTPFTAGSGIGLDADLDALGKTGAIDPTTGAPSVTASIQSAAQGSSNPFNAGGGMATGGTGATGSASR